MSSVWNERTSDELMAGAAAGGTSSATVAQRVQSCRALCGLSVSMSLSLSVHWSCREQLIEAAMRSVV